MNDSGQVEVFYVVENGPGDKAGLKEGDVLLGINGLNAKFLGGLRAVREMFRAEPGTKYEVEVERDGKTKKINLKLADIYANL